MIITVAAFFTHSLAVKVRAGDLQVSRSPWLAMTLALASVSVFVLSAVLVQQCRQQYTRAGLLYLLAPVGMYGYFACRLLAG